MNRTISLGGGHQALVSQIDYDEVARFRWGFSPDGTTIYAKRFATKVEMEEGAPKTIRLHRYILREQLAANPLAPIVMHLDGNGLNCTRGNLKTATYSENNHWDYYQATRRREIARVLEVRSAHEYNARLRSVNALLGEAGLAAEFLSEALGLGSPERVRRLLHGIHRSAYALEQIEAYLDTAA